MTKQEIISELIPPGIKLLRSYRNLLFDLANAYSHLFEVRTQGAKYILLCLKDNGDEEEYLMLTTMERDDLELELVTLLKDKTWVELSSLLRDGKLKEFLYGTFFSDKFVNIALNRINEIKELKETRNGIVKAISQLEIQLKELNNKLSRYGV